MTSSITGSGPAASRQSSRIRKTVDTFNPTPAQKQSNLSIQKRGRHAVFESLRTRKSISKKALVGKKVKRFFPHYGGALGTIRSYTPSNDTYHLTYSDGHSENIGFHDLRKLLPKSYKHLEFSANYASACEHLNAAVFSAVLESDVYANTPKSWQEALQEPFRATWLPEMTREYHDLGTNRQCWKIIDRTDVPAGATLIDSVWDFKCKFRNGVFEKHRARICGKGYQQKKGVDYFASFSPTASQVSIRLVYSVTALPGWRTVDLDASAAFISAILPPNEYVYMNPIPGFPLPDGKCLQVVRPLYGLVQAPLAFYRLVKLVYTTKCHLRQLKSDQCVFIRIENNLKSGGSLQPNDILENGFFQQFDSNFVPLSNRIYPSCQYSLS